MPTILYAEDEQEHRMMMQVILKNQEGVTLLEASNGEEAIEEAMRHRPDLVLLDLFMPKVDGFGVLEAMKADPTTQHIPVIILSAWHTGDNRERASNSGAADFLNKPYDPLELMNVVKKYLSNPGSYQ